MAFDWDKLRVFHAAAEAGSFTHAGDKLHLSQSAVSRQVSGLEQDVGVPLFHRHARGLVLTEQGEMLYRTVHEVFMKLENVRARMTDGKDQPSGNLCVTTTVGLGGSWLTERVAEFVDLYPEISLELIYSDLELDLMMREADCAIRLRPPQQPDLIQRKLFTVHFHLVAAPSYINRFGKPRSIGELDEHRIVTFGESVPNYLAELNWLHTAGRPDNNPRSAAMKINNILSIKRAVQLGAGIAMLPDYMIDQEAGFVHLLPETDVPSFDTYFVYPEAMRNQAKMKVFRDFLLTKARSWSF